jgi:hypothetical protein
MFISKTVRTAMIIGHVQARSAEFGRDAEPRAATPELPVRRITDDPRWEALVTKGHTKAKEVGTDGGDWDLFELFVYRERKITAIFRGGEVIVRFYVPGPWEPIFIVVQSGDNVPLRPSLAG